MGLSQTPQRASRKILVALVNSVAVLKAAFTAILNRRISSGLVLDLKIFLTGN